MTADDWVQLDEAMRITGRAKPTLYRWIKEGKVKAIQPAKALWLNVHDLRQARRDTRRGRPPKDNSRM